MVIPDAHWDLPYQFGNRAHDLPNHGFRHCTQKPHGLHSHLSQNQVALCLLCGKVFIQGFCLIVSRPNLTLGGLGNGESMHYQHSNGA